MALRKKTPKDSQVQKHVTVAKIPLVINHDTFHRLTEARLEAAKVWNACVQIAQHFYFEDKYWISESELRKMLAGQFNLHSQCIQNVIEKYCENRENTSKLRKQGLTQWKYPWKYKKYYPVIWSSQGISLEGNKITLKMGRGRKPIVLDLPVALDQVNRVELVYQDGKYFLNCAITEVVEKPEKPGTKLAAIDLGEIHAMTITDGTEALIVTGRALRAIKQYRTKRLAGIQKAMARCKKHSRKWKKLLKAKRRVLSKTRRQILDLNHKITRIIANWCVKHQIGKVVVGTLDGVQRNTSKKKSKKVNQKLSQWEFGKQTQLLDYKLKRFGIKLTKKSEAYTSQTCPVCGHRHKPKGRVFKCHCGYTEHRDVVGSLNFWRLSLYGEMKPQPTTKLSLKYLRPFAYRQRKVVVVAEPQPLRIVA